MILRRETNIYDDEAIKNSIASVEKKFSATYGTCETANSTKAKVVVLEDFELFKGAQISVHFAYNNTASAPTLDVNGTGAKAIWARGAAIAATYYWSANSTHTFTYDGTHWVLDNAESQEEVFNRLTNNDTNSGLYIENGSLYLKADYIRSGKISADYIYGGKLTLGGANNGNGLLVVYNASGAEVGRWDKDGVSALGTFESIYEWYYDPGPGGGTARTVTTKTLFDSGCVYFYGDAEDTYAQAAIGLSNILRPGYGGFTDPTTAPLNITVNYGGAIYFVRRTSSGNYWKVLVFDETHQPQINSTSSKRFKHDITDQIDEDLNAHKLYKLHMKQFVFNDDHIPQYDDMRGLTVPGFIAEDVAEIYPAAVIHDADGNIESWDERRIIPAMLKLIQEQHEEIEKLKQVIHVV